VAAISPQVGPRKLPLTLGLVRVTGATVDGQRPTDRFDITSGPAGDVGITLLDLRLRQGEPDEIARIVAGHATQGFRERTPLHAIMLDLSRALIRHAVLDLRVTLIRCSAADARVEVTTAGMPPVACAHPDGHITLHGVASTALTASTIAPPPVEMVPLVWGATWLALSDGFTSQADTDHAAMMQRLARQLSLAEEGLLLSQQSPETLRPLLNDLISASDRSRRDDATVILLAADPSARSESGIQRGT
jgi:hypothetical protein